MMLMDGAWISPDCVVYNTSNAQSHLATIKELGLEEFIRDKANSISWSEKEVEDGANEDLALVAMCLGFIRITSFDNQIGISSGVSLEDIAVRQFEILIKVVSSFYISGCQICYENMRTTHFYFFHSIDQLKQQFFCS